MISSLASPLNFAPKCQRHHKNQALMSAERFQETLNLNFLCVPGGVIPTLWLFYKVTQRFSLSSSILLINWWSEFRWGWLCMCLCQWDGPLQYLLSRFSWWRGWVRRALIGPWTFSIWVVQTLCVRASVYVCVCAQAYVCIKQLAPL